MKKKLGILLIFPALLLVTTTSVSQEKGKGKDKEASPTKATPADYQKLANERSFTGKVSMTAKGVSFRIDDAEYQKQLKIAAKAKDQKAAKAQVERQYATLKWALGKEFELEFEKGATLQKLRAPAVEFDIKTGFPKASKYTGPPYPATPEDFGGDYITVIKFGGTKDGKPLVRSALVDNKAW